MVNLIMHCGGHHVSRDAVQNAPTPERTNTWVPIPHNRLLEIAEATIEQHGYTVINEAHGLWGEGARYFGLLELADQNPSRDYSLILGLRNSHDKSFPASFALGSQVLVCDNLSFIGEVVLNRRHTRFISRDLPGIVMSRRISARPFGKSSNERDCNRGRNRFRIFAARERPSCPMNSHCTW